MNVQLGLVRSCLGDRCRVRLLEDHEVVEVYQDQRSQDRSRLRFGQLVALRTDPTPVILWRWYRCQLLVVRPSHALVVLPEGRTVSARLGVCLPAEDGRYEEAWVTVAGGVWQAHDGVRADSPAHPACLLRWAEAQPIPAVA